MQTHKEIERKFILKRFPKSILKDKHYKHLRITQYYFLIDGIWNRFRVAYDIQKGTTKYIHTIKKKISQGINDETEGSITKKKFESIYQKYGNAKNTGTAKIIKKERYVLKYKKLKFEIDIYKSVHLITMEVELPSLDHPIEFLPELQNLIIADVTNIKGFSNLSLAEVL